MMIAYIPANAAWAVIIGDALVDLDGLSLFPDRDDLVYQLNEHGLVVLGDGVIGLKK